jgi:hypothetical protein
MHYDHCPFRLRALSLTIREVITLDTLLSLTAYGPSVTLDNDDLYGIQEDLKAWENDILSRTRIEHYVVPAIKLIAQHVRKMDSAARFGQFCCASVLLEMFLSVLFYFCHCFL